jgi:putative two-component system response regulator
MMHGKTAFILSENTMNRSRIEEILLKEEMEVFSFDSIEAAQKNFTRFKPDVVFVDRRFRGKPAGLSFCRWVRKNHPEPYSILIILSILSKTKEINEALDAGADDYLVKPYNQWNIRTRLRVALRWLSRIQES